MDLEDFFKNKRQYKHRPRDYYQGNRRQTEFYNNEYEQFNLLAFLNKIRSNKKLKGFILVILIVIIAIIIGVIAVLFPLLMNLFSYISQNGISGITEIVLDFLNKLWNGTK